MKISAGPGTENVPAIVGMAAAAEWVLRDRARGAGTRKARCAIVCGNTSRQSFPAATQNGDATHRLANTLNVSFAGLSSETILMALDLEGVCASSGSACMVGSVVASHVLLAMGLPAIAGQLRRSLLVRPRDDRGRNRSRRGQSSRES